jgi:hypothetical protein
LLAAQLQNFQKGSPADEVHGLEQPELRQQAQKKDSKSEAPQPAHVGSEKDQYRILPQSLKRPADGKSFSVIGTDGIYRVVRYHASPPD